MGERILLSSVLVTVVSGRFCPSAASGSAIRSHSPLGECGVRAGTHADRAVPADAGGKRETPPLALMFLLWLS